MDLLKVVEEPGICEVVVSKTHGSTMSRSVRVWLHEEPVEGLEGFDPNDFLSGFWDVHGVSDLGLREDPGSLLRCLCARGRGLRVMATV